MMPEININKAGYKPLPENQKLVVLISDSVSPRAAKIGYGLKLYGWKVILLFGGHSYISDLTKCFDEIYTYKSPGDAINLALNFNPVVYHVFSVWNFDIASLLIMNKVGKVVFDNYDTLTGMVRKEIVDPSNNGLLESERFCIENADGLCCRDTAIQYVRKHFNYFVKGKTIFFPDYCWDQGDDSISTINDYEGHEKKEIHLAYAGGVNVEKIHRTTPYSRQFKNGYFLEFARDLAASGIHFHIYPQATICAPGQFNDVFSEYLKLEAETGYFHIHRPVPNEILLKELAGYDLGLESSWSETRIIGSEASLPVRNYYSMSNKVFDYLDAGLGLILGDDFRTRRWMFEKKGLAVIAHLDIIKEKILSTPPPVLKSLRENALKARKTFSIKIQAKRLSDFYLSLSDTAGVKVITSNNISPKMKIFADRQYLLPGQSYIPMLNPFWGKANETHLDNGRFRKYELGGCKFFEQTSLDRSDAAILPGVFPYWNKEAREIALQLSRDASDKGKPVVLFFNTDSDEDLKIDNSIIFRTSMYKSTRRNNEYAMPGWSVDFVEHYLGSRLPLRHKISKPVVSFCGLVPPLPHVRYRALSRLLQSKIIQQNFIIRDKFWGGALGDGRKEEIVRREFVQNMIDGDYVLCMRGAGNFSYRLYETLSMGRIPVFINTDCVLPYEDFIDWKKYCVWVEEGDIDSIDKIIADFHNKISPDEFIELQHNCRKLWEEWLSPEGFFANFHRHFKDAPFPTPLEKGGMGGFEQSCLFINTYYNGFLNSIYKKSPELLNATFNEQKTRLQGQFFGDSDFYSEGLKKAGWDADDLIVNCLPLQDAWAGENGYSGKGIEIAFEQIKLRRPEVVYIQDLSLCNKDFLSAIRPFAGLIVGQIASPVPPQTYIQGFDIIFTSFPHFVERFRKEGVISYYLPLAFDPRVLERVKGDKRHYPVTFVGGISHVHSSGTSLLGELVKTTPIELWGYGAESLPSESLIRRQHHGEVWGLDMFSILSQSMITVNRHIDVAENNANNMRLFEATGCGALLITDYKDNLNSLFEVGKEVVAYRSPEECAALIKYYLAHPDEAKRIADAGQKRTLTQHTYENRMKVVHEILTRHLRYRRDKNKISAPDMSKISYGHSPIQQRDITEQLTSAWKNPEIPDRQRALVQQELSSMYKGEIPLPYRVLAEILRPYITPRSSVLEIGCSSGYYYEALEYLLNIKIDYTGVDYSEPFIEMAKDYYPDAKFFVSDGANMFFEDRKFHTVISSCILLHTPNYREHIYETARVANDYVVAHRTPVCRARPPQYLKKYAYGVETVELIFNEKEILREFSINRLKLIKAIEFYKNEGRDEYTVTYLFKKV